jgi:photosystem II stability/assembly factor-like uncharacterized protein
MSNAPYNNYSVLDLSGNEQPYVNSTSEFGYFSGRSVGTIPKSSWHSLPAVLTTNNGLAILDTSGGLTILNSGIYKINLSLFPTLIQDGSTNISFCFGSTYLSNISSTTIVNAFGGPHPSGMFTYDPSYNPTKPGIISWVANGYSSGNSTTSNFVKNSTTNELGYEYYTGGNSTQTLYSGICTTEITFIINSQTSIFFNVSTNSSTGVSFGNCCFTLQLISNLISPPSWGWIQRAFPANWRTIASSNDGTKLAAIEYPGNIYTSSDSGVSWSPCSAAYNKYWSSIASDSTGTNLVACVNGGVIYLSSDSGLTWNPQTITESWISIASDSTGKNLAAAAQTGDIYISDSSGSSWTSYTVANTKLWSIASSSDGSHLAATEYPGYIFTSSDSGQSWSNSNNAGSNRYWTSIASDSLGTNLAACVNGGYIYTSSDLSHNNWTQQYISKQWVSITSDSTGRYLAALAYQEGIYISSDYGVNWSESYAVNNIWYSITSSSDGKKLAAVAMNTGNGGIYTGTYS